MNVAAHTGRANPPYPGRQVKTALEASNLTVTEAAEHLGVTRTTLSRVINGQAGISSEMAIRLHKFFGGRGADMWVRLQATYDLAQAMKYFDEIDVTPLKKVA